MEAIDIEVIEEEVLQKEEKNEKVLPEEKKDLPEERKDIYDDSVKFNVIPDFNNNNRDVDSVFVNEEPRGCLNHHEPNTVEISEIPEITKKEEIDFSHFDQPNRNQIECNQKQEEIDFSHFNQPNKNQSESNPFDFQMITQHNLINEFTTPINSISPVNFADSTNQIESASISPQSEFKHVHNINDDIIVVDSSSPNTLQSHEAKTSKTTSSQDFFMVNSFNPNFNLNTNLNANVKTNLSSDDNFQVINNFYPEGEDEETIALRKRQAEHEERQRAVRMRIEQELREKSEMRLKAREYLERYNV
jgi:hypothetical protein